MIVYYILKINQNHASSSKQFVIIGPTWPSSTETLCGGADAEQKRSEKLREVPCHLLLCTEKAKSVNCSGRNKACVQHSSTSSMLVLIILTSSGKRQKSAGDKNKLSCSKVLLYSSAHGWVIDCEQMAQSNSCCENLSVNFADRCWPSHLCILMFQPFQQAQVQ